MIWNILNPRRTALVQLPRIFSRDTMYQLIGALISADQDCEAADVTLDFARLEKIQVGGIAILSNLIEAQRKAGTKVGFKNAETCEATKFLQGSGFIAQYVGGPEPAKRASNRFFPLQLVEYRKSQSYIANRLAPWLAESLGVEEDTLGSILVCFEEIFNNIADHSTVKVGCSCGYFDKALGQITICISDFGVGIPSNVRKKIKIGNDSAAIAMACQQGFTTQTTPANMGAGLHILINNVVTLNGGTVIIHSGSGIYSCVPNTPKMIAKGRRARGFYPGTLIYITLDVQRFVPTVAEEKFEWNLSEF